MRNVLIISAVLPSFILCPPVQQALYADSPGALVVTPASLDFTAWVGDDSPPGQVLRISNDAGNAMAWTIEEDCPWLSLSRTSGAAQPGYTSLVTAYVATAGLSQGHYTCQLVIHGDPAADSPKIVPVSLRIHGAVLELSPTALDYQALQAGANPPAQAVTIRNSGIVAFDWTIQADTPCNWLSVDPPSGTAGPGTAANVLIAVDLNNLAGGDYACDLTVTAPGAETSPQTLTVNLHVTGPLLTVSPDRINFTASPAAPNPPDAALTLANAGGGALEWTVTSAEPCPWLYVSPASGTLAAGQSTALVLSVDAAELAPGLHTCLLRIEASDGQTRDVPVQLIIPTNGVITVPTDCLTIQDAIDAADPNFITEVVILPGTYTGKGNRDIDFKGKPITVRSINPDDPNTVAATVIDCQGTEADPHRGFHFHSGETETSVLKGLTITNGYGAKYKLYHEYTRLYSVGGGVLLLASSPALEQLTFGECRADVGGAICTSESSSFISKCEISRCTAFMSGGGIFLLRGSAHIDRCTVRESSSNYNAGGVSADNDQSMLTNCRIIGNQAPRGGGVHCHESSMRFDNCQVSSNTATDSSGQFAYGGALYISWLSDVDVHNCLLAGNSSSSNGGSMYVEASGAVMTNCTIAGNRAAGDGGGIFGEAGNPFGSSVQLRDCIVWGNQAGRGNQIAFAEFSWDDDPWFGGLGATFSDIQGGLDEVFRGGGRITFGEGTIDAEPLFADPGQWLDNGTPEDPSDDNWIDGDYHLKSQAGRWNPAAQAWTLDPASSPCIDAGDHAADYALEPHYNGQRRNMGAYGNTPQASRSGACTAQPPADLNNDCRVDVADLAILAANWLTCNLNPPIACEQ